MVTADSLRQTFYIRYRDGEGSGFVIVVDGREYFVTAKHIVRMMDRHDYLEIWRHNAWMKVGMTLVGHAPGQIDISVLAIAEPLALRHLSFTGESKGLVLSQDVFFLGFPYKLRCELGGSNNGYPIPFVKKATMSCFGKTSEGTDVLLLDGFNNLGFSGGPVVFVDLESGVQKVCGVVSGGSSYDLPVLSDGKETGSMVKASAGIIRAFDIGHALEIIAENPIGMIPGESFLP